MGTLRDGKVHPDLPSVKFSSVHLLPRLGRVRDVLVVDKGEPAAAAGVAVQDDLQQNSAAIII